MDTSYLTTQVATIISQLHGLFDEIGVASQDRESREAELFAALSDTLNNQVRLVAAEKNEMVDEARRIVTAIKQMDAALDNNKDRLQYEAEDEELKIKYPLSTCLQALKEKHLHISKLHRERFEQVKKLVDALESYSSHLERSFVKIVLPPTAPNSSIPPTFDLSPIYVNALDSEFTRVYEEYTRRVATVQGLAENMIQLWAELGTPQAQTDPAVVQNYRDSPEQLGLHENDITRLKAKRDKLAEEKKGRERRLIQLRETVEQLWDRLAIEEHERKQFLNANRGCGLRQINDFEDELDRLNELKRQNLGLFVEDAREKLQVLWDELFFSEEEMLEFTPAFSDVYSDALLEAHEQEIARLGALKDQRAPTLALIEKHRSLVKDRDDLQAASQDASRLMMRGQKGEKRDPTRLLREEKMRKRIAKDLPKIAVEVRKALESWEGEYDRPFLVHGVRYIDELDASEAKPAPGPRSKTPAGPAAGIQNTQKALPQKPDPRTGRAKSEMRPPPSRTGAKTPGMDSIRRNPMAQSMSAATAPSAMRSPTRIPAARAPLANLTSGSNSPERYARPASEMKGTGTVRRMGPPARAPPPRMRDIFDPPSICTPLQQPRNISAESANSVRPVALEDVYDDRRSALNTATSMSRPQLYHSQSSMRHDRPQIGYRNQYGGEQYENYPSAPPGRLVSNSSCGTTVQSTSENWETFSDASEAEADMNGRGNFQTADDRNTGARQGRGSQSGLGSYGSYSSQGSQSKRDNPYAASLEYGIATQAQNKRLRSLAPPTMTGVRSIQTYTQDGGDGQRVVSGSEAGWTEDGE